MSKSKHQRDPIRDMQEWQEHQYNPGYWINRFRPWFPLRRSYVWAILLLVQAGMGIAAFLAMCWSYYKSNFDADMIVPVCVMGLYGAVTLVGGLRLWPRRAHTANRRSRRVSSSQPGRKH
jgi:hypothetical protein